VAFDENVIDGKLKNFVALTKGLAAPLLTEQVQHVESAFKDLRTLILAASACAKPSDSSWTEQIRKDVNDVVMVPEANRKERVWFDHLQVVASGIPSVGWVEAPTPGPYINEMKESSVFFGNKIIKAFKEKDQKHVDWVRAWMALLEEQRKYVMEYHTTGLVWNPRGMALKDYSQASSGSSAAPGPPPPPPPPPAGAPPAPKTSSAADVTAVFAQLNRGEEVTKGLRKVDPSQMTHKNPELRASSVVPAGNGSGVSPQRPTKPSKPAALASKKPTPSKFALEGNKWIIEFQENQRSLVVDQVETSHVINVFGCKNSVIQVKGKVNAVVLVNCVKTSVVVDSVISSISIATSPSFELQVTGTAPTIQLDKCDDGQIYLSKASLDVSIVTAKCSGINVSLPVEGEEEGVFTECPVPEVMMTTVKDGKLVTTILEHS